jgi:hypothetical protein
MFLHQVQRLVRAQDGAGETRYIVRTVSRLDAPTSVAAWLRTDSIAKRLFSGRPGKMVSVSLDGQGQMQRLVARFPVDAEGSGQMSHFWRLTVEDSPAGLRSSIIAAPLESHVRLASGTITSTLFSATDEAGIPDSVAAQIADITGQSTRTIARQWSFARAWLSRELADAEH